MDYMEAVVHESENSELLMKIGFITNDHAVSP